MSNTNNASKIEKEQAFKTFMASDSKMQELKATEKKLKAEMESARAETQTRHGVATSTDGINDAKYFNCRSAWQEASDATDAYVESFLATL